MKPSLCLNMIVKNEAGRILRCLNSVLPYVKAVAILDTGSTDNTRDLIKNACEVYGVPSFTHAATFKNFSQARNDAFNFAQRCNGGCLPECQFALLMDADMELVVTDPDAFMKLDARALAYDMMQKAGTISYANRRILNLSHVNDRPYVGVTHEYIDVPAMGMIQGASFIDHADGANRADKYPRDAQLLEDALKKEPENGRYWYYLGNTYRDWGKHGQALECYRKRVSLGGWDEETHSAMMNEADCLRHIGSDAGFVKGLIAAHNFRPQRIEPLYELAKLYREKNQPNAAIVFAAAGVNKKRPDDLLFVNDFVYSHGMRYEYSVVGYYDEAHRRSAFAVTDALSLDPTCPPSERMSARSNLYWYTKPIKEYCPSFAAQRLAFKAPDGYTAMNPSVAIHGDKIMCNVRCVNYKIDEQGRYMIGPKECGDAPIDTINYLLELDAGLNPTDESYIIWDRPLPKFNMVTGLEDIRLWSYCGDLRFNATVREQSERGICQQITGEIVYDLVDKRYATATNTKLMSGEICHEKNWMPMPSRPFSHPRFVYRLDKTIEPGEKVPETKFDIPFCPDNISGSSQAVPFDGGFLAVVHEAAAGPDGKRTYWHRLVYFTKDGRPKRLSIPFVFFDRQIEFCAGLAPHPNHHEMVISFGVRDAEAHVARVSRADLHDLLWRTH